MSEIRVEIDLPHPAGRVWRGLTGRHMLPTWFPPPPDERGW